MQNFQPHYAPVPLHHRYSPERVLYPPPCPLRTCYPLDEGDWRSKYWGKDKIPANPQCKLPQELQDELGLTSPKLRVLQALVKAGVRSDLRKGISYSKQSQARIEEVCAKVVKRFPELSFGAKADALKKLIRMESREYNRESGSKGSDPSSANQENDEECEVFEDSYAEEEDADAEEEDAEEDEIDD
ncbi:hypothetical protein DFP72DRAFT_1172776 [Ephemerocybe angulata]|uniref:Uncharacterized protein n=1 Tax=Ephemerocybe angulata TaxID=980116 RepID=A0A8H6HQ58_9AGAR|nr:hypothetical protein DFP72DRAFT_1172776 [Tulosesus angulatus]